MKEDKEPGCGYGILKVEDEDNEAFCRVHDYGYERGSLSQETMGKDEFDSETIDRFADYNESRGRFGGAFRLRYIYRPLIWGFTKVFKLWEGKR